MQLRILVLCCLSLIITSCTEVEYASHLVKSGSNKNTSQGLFKVGNSYRVDGRWYHPEETYNHSETGIASWYGAEFHGKPTANGEIFDMNELTAAHKTLQLPSLVRVTNLENGRSLVVRVNDRGPFKRSRVIDLSKRAAELLGFKNKGTAKVRLQVLSQESMAIAEAARRGQDTRGVEIAMNEKGRLPATISRPDERPPVKQQKIIMASTAPSQRPGVQPVERASLTPAVPGHVSNGTFYPDAVVTTVPVTPTTIYVQAGAFTILDNAQILAQQLQTIGRAKVYPAMVNSQQFYRVRIPAENVEQADALLARVAEAGNKNAIIVVD